MFSINSEHELTQRQSAKALANLGVNIANKRDIALKGTQLCLRICSDEVYSYVLHTVGIV
jgi:hypothetical protein